MKLHFEPDLDYQKLAIDSVADLFRGQEINRTEFTVTRRPLADRDGQPNLDLGGFLGAQGELGLVESELGIGNRLTLLDDEIIANLKDIQLRNGLAPSTEACLRRLHGRDGDGHGQNICLPANDL